MRTIFCMSFSVVWLGLQFFLSPDGDYTALVVSQVWLAGGIVSMGGDS